ncbi:SRPBCC family protein [Gordonia sp. (in: high G+C Gram-positive bacteria)]|uniref:SRPBCC family protein n=1 Tax=Gordonia sp. (in: high G+C Gram-positive bacteria) TaxID=84139 RepID=UPI0039E70A38
MSSTAPTVSVETSIDASADTVYALLTDLPTLAELGEEIDEMRWIRGDSAAVGNVFRGRNRNGRHRWSTTCTVTDAAPTSVFAWDVTSLGLPIARWRYDITPTSGGCTVVESMWDRRPGFLTHTAHLLTGIRDRETANAEHMRATLERLTARAEGL